MLMCRGVASTYSVLTDKEIVDLLWSSEVLPLIRNRYPGSSKEQIKKAHAYPYGGRSYKIVATSFGSVEFKQPACITFRVGDFVRKLLAESNDADEY